MIRADTAETASQRPGGGRDRYFQVGGALDPSKPSYLERAADQELFAALEHGDLCYVLDTRQMGKSSLIARVGRRLKEAGAAVAFIDLSGFGHTLTIDQWYVAQLEALGKELNLQAEINDFVDSHEELGPVDLWSRAIREVLLVRLTNHRIVIVFDEIDFVRILPFPTDEYFTAIRHLTNNRANVPGLDRLTFCLLGVATPQALIRGADITPFNLGRRIELTDFDEADAEKLLPGLHADLAAAARLLHRIIYWTDGHPYLTQSLCAAVSRKIETEGDADVDDICAEVFFAAGARDSNDNLRMVVNRLFSSGIEQDKILGRYQAIRSGEDLPYDAEDPLTSVLKLSGIAKVVDGHWVVRNRIYAHVFDDEWIRDQLTPDEVRRQQAAARKARNRTLWGAAAVAAFMMGVLSVGLMMRERQLRVSEQALRMQEQDRGQQLRDALGREATLRQQQQNLLQSAEEQAQRAAAAELEARRQAAVATQKEREASLLRLKAEQTANNQASLAREATRAANDAAAARLHAQSAADAAKVEQAKAQTAALELKSANEKLADANSLLVPLQLATQSSIARTQQANLIDRAALFAIEALGPGPSRDAYVALMETMTLMPAFEAKDLFGGRRLTGATIDSSSQLLVASLAPSPGATPQLCAIDLRTLERKSCWDESSRFQLLSFATDRLLVLANDRFETREVASGRVVPGEVLEDNPSQKDRPIGPVAVSPEGGWELRWNIPRNEYVLRVAGSDRPVRTFPAREFSKPVFSAKGRYLFIDSIEGSAWKLERVSGGKVGVSPVASRNLDSAPTSAAAFSPDETLFARATSAVTIWSLSNDRPIATLPQSDRVEVIAFSADSRFVAISQPSLDSVRVFARSGGEIARTHYQGLSSAAFTTVGGQMRLVTFGGPTVRLWSIQDWPPRLSLPGTYGLAPAGTDGSFLAVPGTTVDNRTIRIRKVSDPGQVVRAWSLPRVVDALDVSHDGRRVAVLSAVTQSMLEIFAVDAAVPVRAPVARNASLLGFNADGSRLALFQPSCSAGTLCFTVTDTRSGTPVFEKSFGGGRVWGRIASDGRSVVVTDKGTLYSFDGEGREISVQNLPGSAVVTSAAFDQTGTRIVVRRGTSLVLFDTRPNAEPMTLGIAPDMPVGRLVLSPRGRFLASIGSNQFRLMDLTTRKPVSTVDDRDLSTAVFFFSEDDGRLVRRQGERLISYSTASGEKIDDIALPRGARAISRDGQSVVTVEGTVPPGSPAAATTPKSVLMLNGVSIENWPQATTAATAFGVNTGANRLVVASAGRVEVFDTNSRSSIAVLPEPPLLPIRAVALTNGARRVIAAAAHEIFVWDVGDPQAPLRFSTPFDVSRISSDSTGTTTAVTRTDGSVEIMPAVRLMAPSAEGTNGGADFVIREQGLGDRVSGLSPDGRWFAAALTVPRADGPQTSAAAIRIWNVEAKQAVKDLPHDAEVLAFAFNPTGTHLASATPGLVRIWQTSNWREVGRLTVSGQPTSLVFSADNTRLGVASEGSIYVAPWRRQDLIREACERLTRKTLIPAETKDLFGSIEGLTLQNYCDGNNLKKVIPN